MNQAFLFPNNEVLLGVMVFFWLACAAFAVEIGHTFFRQVNFFAGSRAAELAFFMSSGLLAAGFLGFLWLLVTQIVPARTMVSARVLFGLACLPGALSLRQLLRREKISIASWVLLVLTGGLILLSMFFVTDLYVPQYFDSLEHFEIIQDFLHSDAPPQAFYSLSRMGQRYYHFGYHAVTAWLTALLGADPRRVMLVWGQLILALSAVSVFFFAHTLLKSEDFALAAMLLAGIGWSMPAYAVNWGKYPAILAVAVLPLSLGTLVNLFAPSNKWQRSWGLFFFGALAITTWFHSRALIVAGLFFISIMLAKIGLGGRAWLRWPWAALLIGFMVAYVHHDPAFWGPFLTPASLILALLLIPALRDKPFESLTLLFWMAGLLLASQVTIPGMPRSQAGLVDRPFVQLVFPIPLATLTGLGLMALSRYSWVANKPLKKAGAAFLATGLLAWFILSGVAKPNACCQFVDTADVYAFTWIENQLPLDAKIVIAGFAPPYRKIGNDAGIWIEALTGRKTYLVRYDANWNSAKWHSLVCENGAAYIYAGGGFYSFRQPRLENAEWYQSVFELPPVRVYAIRHCPESQSFLPMQSDVP